MFLKISIQGGKLNKLINLLVCIKYEVLYINIITKNEIIKKK